MILAPSWPMKLRSVSFAGEGRSRRRGQWCPRADGTDGPLDRCSARAIEDDVERGLLQLVIAGHDAIGSVIGELSCAAPESAVTLAASWDDVVSRPAGRRGVVPPVAPKTHVFG
jgi:hypothetical protein